MADEKRARRAPTLFRNYMSLVGAAIVLASLASVTLLFLLEISSSGENPYLGILTYIIFPSILILSLKSFKCGEVYNPVLYPHC